MQTPAGELAGRMDGGAGDPIAAAWESIRANLRRDCGARTFDGWLRPIALGGFDADSGALRLQLPSQFMADWVQTHFAERLALAWKAMLPQVEQIRIGVGPAAPRTAAVVEIPAPRKRRRRRAERGPYAVALEPRYRFENFVVGKANEVAFSAAQTLATADKVAFNPLFIHGGTGRGKTHLLHAIGHEFHRQQPRAKIIYMSAEKFTVEFLARAAANETFKFKQQLRSADLLMIDDVQFIAGKEFDPGRILPHDERDHLGRPALRDQLGPRAAGPRRARAAHPVAPSWGLVADINAGRSRAPAQHHHQEARVAARRDVPDDVVMFLANRRSARTSASSKARSTGSPLMPRCRTGRSTSTSSARCSPTSCAPTSAASRSTRSRPASPIITGSARPR